MGEHSAISAHTGYSDPGTGFRDESFVFLSPAERWPLSTVWAGSMLLPALTADGVGFRV